LVQYTKTLVHTKIVLLSDKARLANQNAVIVYV
jgi:hypothetical protein